MRPDAEQDGQAQWAKTDDDRITRLGNILRKYRLDELPQLYNVFHGEMSLVGPRPERPEFVEQLTEEIPYYNERHLVKPGLTGWAQLNYSYGASVEDSRKKHHYDLYYLKNFSIFLDFLIMLQTVEVMIWKKGSR
jgi:lipopolysaccharide/colanic/teichoic acid biosynthesis glycosyltransferase